MIELFTEFRNGLQNCIIKKMHSNNVDTIPLSGKYKTIDDYGRMCCIGFNRLELKDWTLVVDYSVKCGNSIKSYEDEFWTFSCNEMFEIVKDVDSFFGGRK